MPVVEVNDLASIGQVNDVPAYQLPPEAWTLVENMRFVGGGVAVMDGWSQVFGTPPVAPHFALPVKSSSQTWWPYVSLNKAYVFDGSSHTNITRQTTGVDVDYTTNTTQEWNGVVFNGVPIFNNSHDVPQYWASYSSATKLVALPNWPSTLRAAIVRNFGSRLVAFNLVDSGTSYPHLVQWSSAANPGSVPTSWDYTSSTSGAGRNDLPDINSGFIKEALQLQNAMFIYKERSTWKMTFIGGTFIYQFDQFLSNVGILAARCVCVDATGLQHIVVTQDDIIIHNGNSSQSILTDKQRYTLFNSINRDAADVSFIFLNRAKDEVWFCFPEQGQTIPTRALVWNYKGGKGAISYASGITFRNAVLADVEGTSSELWSTGTDTWDQDTGAWSQIFRYRVVLLSPDNTKFYLMDSTTTRDGASFNPTLQRVDLGVVGQKRNGEAVNDFKQVKMVDSIWPKIDGATTIRIRVGFRDAVASGAPLVWQDYTTFNPVTDMWVNTIVNENIQGCGRAVAVEFSNTNSNAWRLDGYSINVEALGPY